MGGRGSGSRIVSTRPPQAQAGAQAQTAAPTGGPAARVYAGPFVHMTQQDADDMAQAHALHQQMGVICYENEKMGIYFIEDPDGYWIEIVPAR